MTFWPKEINQIFGESLFEIFILDEENIDLMTQQKQEKKSFSDRRAKKKRLLRAKGLGSSPGSEPYLLLVNKSQMCPWALNHFVNSAQKNQLLC